MHNDIKVSIIIIAKCEKHELDKCIYSILGQTHSLFEALVVFEDEEKLKKIDVSSYGDGRLTPVIGKKNVSIEEMLRDGICEICSASKYYLCVDGEDYVGKDYVNVMLSEIIEDDVDVLCGGTIISKDNGKYIEIVPDVVWNKIYRREAINVSVKVGWSQNGSYFRKRNDNDKFERRKKFDCKIDDLKEALFDSKYDYISFDIFDTLVQRPFYEPTDLLLLLDLEFEKYTSCNISFAEIRKAGEEDLRKEKCNDEVEDITIDEIYKHIHKSFNIDEYILKKMEEAEKALEVKYTFARKTVRSIYQLAVDSGKKIIFISDMYLDINTINMILKKNGYSIYEKIFLSSEYRKLKGTGNLYRKVLEELNVSAQKILHIGDNIRCDIEKALECGMAAYHIPKAIDVFAKDEYKRGRETCDNMIRKICGSFISFEKVKDSVGYRCMIAQVANKYFDNPFRHYVENSVLNQDPYFIGYYLVGMYLLGINQWIENILEGKRYDKVYFTSRDGWLALKAYNMLRKIKPELPEAEYFYTSRKAVLPAMIKNELDLYDLPIDVERYSPEKLYRLLEFCTEKSEEQWKKTCYSRGIDYSGVFGNRKSMRETVSIFVQDFYSVKKHQVSSYINKKYYEKVNKNSIMFDMGYSGRIQNAISALAGEGIDVMFIHSDATYHDKMRRKGQFQIYSYLNIIPQMSDVLREYLLSEPAASCIGYKEDKEQCLPIFTNYTASKEEQNMIEELQRGAEDFVNEFYITFGTVLEYIPYKSLEISLPLEGFMRFNVEEDREVFADVKFDDVVYGGESNINMKEILEMAMEWLPKY